MCMIQFALLDVSHSCRCFSTLVSLNAQRSNHSKMYLNYCKCIACHLPGSYAINIYYLCSRRGSYAHRSQISQVLTRLLDLLIYLLVYYRYRDDERTFAHDARHARACTLVEIIARIKAGPNACGTFNCHCLLLIHP